MTGYGAALACHGSNDMRPRQIELARHALGLDGRRTHSYRNSYVCGPSPEHTEWCDMVEEGDTLSESGNMGICDYGSWQLPDPWEGPNAELSGQPPKT